MKFFVLTLALGSSFTVFAQTPEQRAEIIKHYDLVELKKIETELTEKNRKEKEEAVALAKLKGMPIKFVDKDGTVKEIMKVIEGEPVYYMTYNTGSARTSRVDRINSGGSAGLSLDGQDMLIGIWDDDAVRKFHQDLTGRANQMDSANEIGNHATHVAGTMIGSGVGNSSAKGMAPEADLWANDWNNDTGEMAAQAAQGLLVSNHSYGLASVPVTYIFGAYIGESYSWDNIVYNAPYYQPVVAAGNDRNADPAMNPSKSGMDLLTQMGVSKNVVVVAAINEVFNYNGPSSVIMSDFSNWGPTDDRRVKPDISSKGVGVLSTWGTSNTAYNSINGTSMASPGVAGALLLLQQHYNNVNDDFMLSATLRGIMAHTADEAGEAFGPDFKFGWGLMNAEAGAAVISGNGVSSVVLETTLNQGETYTRQVVTDGINPLKATISWTDRPGTPNTSGTIDDNTPVLVNDLDLRISKDGTDYMPWRLNTGLLTGLVQKADNKVDNIEKVELPTVDGENFIPPAGEIYTITVTNKGSLVGGSQDFSIIISGIDEAAGIKDNNLSGFTVWPNPANDILNISISDSFNGNLSKTSITIYDLQGRIVKHYDEFMDVIQVSDLSKGIYIFNMNSDGLTTTKKVTIK
ncbi:S8 family serine peptidase [Flavobacterium salilacus subsp. salilacus]|uniref:S8 family serine peptidase n=1 Tax=Flavobacterium salilacus TaxID=2898423 RepID=UPI0013C2E5F7|nr:S8 family serine peptidase [Flavobacterium salilacus]KAF2519545.1 S8 family serine peptidase [Flavobacterium salilacus subsp. salilacus]